MTKKQELCALLIVAATLGVGLYIYHKGEISRRLGGREYVRIISAPDKVQLILTTTFLAGLTNGPLPDYFTNILPSTSINLPAAVVRKLSEILLDPESYDQMLGDTTDSPEIILRFERAGRSLNLEFSDEFRTMLINSGGKYEKLINCEPARDALEIAIGPFLTNKPTSWHGR
jgi:hypothetical protein